jgi:hypothetical protein
MLCSPRNDFAFYVFPICNAIEIIFQLKKADKKRAAAVEAVAVVDSVCVPADDAYLFCQTNFRSWFRMHLDRKNRGLNHHPSDVIALLSGIKSLCWIFCVCAYICMFHCVLSFCFIVCILLPTDPRRLVKLPSLYHGQNRLPLTETDVVC